MVPTAHRGRSLARMGRASGSRVSPRRLRALHGSAPAAPPGPGRVQPGSGEAVADPCECRAGAVEVKSPCGAERQSDAQRYRRRAAPAAGGRRAEWPSRGVLRAHGGSPFVRGVENERKDSLERDRRSQGGLDKSALGLGHNASSGPRANDRSANADRGCHDESQVALLLDAGVGDALGSIHCVTPA